MADQVSFLSATHPPELRVPGRSIHVRHQPTPTLSHEPRSRRVRQLIAAVQCAISTCAILYAIAYRIVVRFVEYVHNVSDLGLAAVLLAMLATLLAGALGWLITTNQVPRYSHPSPRRLFQPVLCCTAGFLSITASITQAVAIFFSSRLVPHFPAQGVELPHHAFLLVLTVLCTSVNLVSVLRYANDALRAAQLNEKIRLNTSSDS